MKDKRLDLQVLMMKLCKVAGIEPTNDLYEFTKRLYEAGFITADELRRVEQIGLQL